MFTRKNILAIYTSVPLRWRHNKHDSRLKKVISAIIHFFFSFFSQKTIGGHYAVTRSILRGLTVNNIDYIYNPNTTISETSLVLSGIDTLEFAIHQKRRGKIKFLLAGPNISVLPSFDNNILAAKEIDVCLVPSRWVKEAYEKDCPELIGRIKIWAAGIDETYWSPEESHTTRNRALIYLKSKNAPIEDVKKLLDTMHIPYTILRYGSYTKQQYKEILSLSKFAIFLSKSESQGIALAEAWAMDVPTFSWNPGEFIYKMHIFKNVSSAPYTTSENGTLWKNIDELYSILNLFLKENTYTPRKWVLENMTDYLCSKHFLSLIHNTLYKD